MAALNGYLTQSPGGAHTADARSRIADLERKAATPTPAADGPASATRPSPPGGDDGDWSFARSIDTYDAYMTYLKSYPQGRHVAAARHEAAAVRPVARAVAEEPPIGELAPGATAIVDDHSCKRGQIKVVTGGNILTRTVRTRKCVPRERIP